MNPNGSMLQAIFNDVPAQRPFYRGMTAMNVLIDLHLVISMFEATNIKNVDHRLPTPFGAIDAFLVAREKQSRKRERTKTRKRDRTSESTFQGRFPQLFRAFALSRFRDLPASQLNAILTAQRVGARRRKEKVSAQKTPRAGSGGLLRARRTTVHAGPRCVRAGRRRSLHETAQLRYWVGATGSSTENQSSLRPT